MAGIDGVTREDAQLCMAVFVITGAITGFALGSGAAGVGAVPGTAAGAAGGFVAGTVICSVGGARAVRTIRNLFEDADAGVKDLTVLLEASRGSVVAGLRRGLSVETGRAESLFDGALAWMKANPAGARRAYATAMGNREGGPSSSIRTAQLASAVGRLSA